MYICSFNTLGMKTYKFLLLAFVALLFSSCEDTSGKYVKYLYTDSDLHTAYSSCLVVATDTALAHLCVPDGFYMSENQSHRIQMPSQMKFIEDTLRAHGDGALIDTMVLHFNRAAEQGGSNIRKVYDSYINAMTYVDPSSFLSSSDLTSLTNYFYYCQYDYLLKDLEPVLKLQMNLVGIQDDWNAVVNAYQQYAPGTVLTCELSRHITEQAMYAIRVEMGEEEQLIRTDDSHRVTEYLRFVFRDIK